MYGPIQSKAAEQSHKIAKEWYDRANDQKQQEVIYRFICAFFALNALYNQVPEDDERMQMVLYARRKCEETGYEPFNEDISEYRAAAVTSELCNGCPKSELCKSNRSNAARRKFKVLKNGGKIGIEELFSAIYRVRCNLFHGSKDANVNRNQKLIEQGTNVINGLLAAIFAKDAFAYNHDSYENKTPKCFKSFEQKQ